MDYLSGLWQFERTILFEYHIQGRGILLIPIVQAGLQAKFSNRFDLVSTRDCLASIGVTLSNRRPVDDWRKGKFRCYFYNVTIT